MPRAIGANSRLLMIPETSYGTPPGGNWRRVPFLTCNLGAEQALLDADVIGLGGNRDPAAPFLESWLGESEHLGKVYFLPESGMMP